MYPAGTFSVFTPRGLSRTINTIHPKFAELRAAILKAISIPEIAKWCGDPYLVMKASTLTDRIAS
ncbi:MAG: hypothetical protein V1887_04605, partial [Candidatus Aenigmatarchaeota archaeon]